MIDTQSDTPGEGVAREAIIEKYASACKRNATEMVSMPASVITQHFREFADELDALPSHSSDHAGLWELHKAEHAKLGQMLLDKSPDGVSAANWQGGKVNGIATAIAALSRAPEAVAFRVVAEPNLPWSFYRKREDAEQAAKNLLTYRSGCTSARVVAMCDLADTVLATPPAPQPGPGWQTDALNDRGNPLHLGNGWSDAPLSPQPALALIEELTAALEPFAEAAERYGRRYLAERQTFIDRDPNLPHNYAQAVMASAEQTGWNAWDAARTAIASAKRFKEGA